MAGTSPKISAVAKATPSVNSRTGAFRRITASAGMICGGIVAISPFKPAHAAGIPAGPRRGQRQALHNELANQRPPPGPAIGHANGELPLARGGPRQQ